MERYEKRHQLGEGTFGVVYAAFSKQLARLVALKKIRLGASSQGVNFTALREIKLLREICSDPNSASYVVPLLDVFSHKSNIFLVFECMVSDLEAVIKDTSVILSDADIKSYGAMMLAALKYIHAQNVVHRDLKPNNLLISSNGTLKLADFGLARTYGSPNPRLTCQVFATWYRAPELLFGARHYGPAVDVFAAACILGELYNRKPLFPGESNIQQLDRVFGVLGDPHEACWPGVAALPDFVPYKGNAGPSASGTPAFARTVQRIVPRVPDNAAALIARMLAYAPSQRPTCAQALEHAYFTSAPAPTPPAKLALPAAARKRIRDDAAAAGVAPPPAAAPPSTMARPPPSTGVKRARDSGDMISPMPRARLRFSEDAPETAEKMAQAPAAMHATPGVPAMTPFGHLARPNGMSVAMADVTPPPAQADNNL